MEVHADTEVCQGHGRCALIAPEVFDVDDMGKVVVRRADVPEDCEAGVAEAIASCPENALAAGKR